jgi:hypothetical protein
MERIILTGENQNSGEKSCLIFSNENPTMVGLGLNPGLGGDIQATNIPNNDTVKTGTFFTKLSEYLSKRTRNRLNSKTLPS